MSGDSAAPPARRDAAVTSIDVARAAGVSQATVSRVLNDDPRVLPATRQRVLDAVAQLHYRPNAIARGLVTRSTGLVGVIVGDITNPFYPELLEAIASQLGEHDLKMLLYNSAGGDEEQFVRLLLEQRVDGIVFPSARTDSALVAELVERDFPLVLLNRYVDGVACDAVVGDNADGARAAAAHLLELGHRRIAIATGPERASTSRDRVGAFRAALADAGVAIPDELVLAGELRYEPAYEGARRLLAATAPPTAVFCANDLMAFGVLSAARAEGVAVPERLSVVGFDSLPMAGWEALDLTTVRQPLPEMAREGVELLAARIADPSRPPQRLTLPSSLVVRGTTAPAPHA
jgi:LacI family transcriptional regulator